MPTVCVRLELVNVLYVIAFNFAANFDVVCTKARGPTRQNHNPRVFVTAAQFIHHTRGYVHVVNLDCWLGVIKFNDRFYGHVNTSP